MQTRDEHESAKLATALNAIEASELGARIKAHRVARNMTQAAVAGDQVSVPYLSRIETGRRKPSLPILVAIAASLHADPLDLVGSATPGWNELSYLMLNARMSLDSGNGENAMKASASVLKEAPPRSELHREAMEVNALALEACGRYDQAASRLEELVREYAGSGTTIKALTALARCYREGGDLGSALAVGKRADEIIEALGMEGTDEAIKLRLTVAAAYVEDNQLGHAKAQCEEALRHAEALADPPSKARCYWQASIVEEARGHKARALKYGRKALHIMEETSEARDLARLRTQTGLLMLNMDPPQVDDALAHLQQADLELRRTATSPSDLAENHRGQALAYFLQGDLNHAGYLATRTLNETAAGAPFTIAELHTLLGRIALARGEEAGAQEHYHRAIHTLYAVGVDASVAKLWFQLGGLLLDVGCREEALDAFRRSGIASGFNPVRGARRDAVASADLA